MTPYLSRPKRSEAEAMLERELKKLPNMNDEDMLDYARMIGLHLQDVLERISRDADHIYTRESANYAEEYLLDVGSFVLGAIRAWKDNPQGMADEIEADRLSHDKDVAADLRRGE